jgi:hypothetical protein
MHPSRYDTVRLMAAPRCGARTRAGHPCRSPRVHGKPRCRMHGGAAGSGAPYGSANGAYKDGVHTKGSRRLRRLISEMLKSAERT